MAHHLYVTPGFVLDSKNSGEANKLLFIFTRDLGLVMTAAQGVRHLKSKLRFHTQPFSFAEFSLVRGKEIWRLTGASEYTQSFVGIQGNKKQMILYAQVCTLLKRLLPGEEPNVDLFNLLLDAFIFFDKQDITKKDPEARDQLPISNDELTHAFEDILVIRILAALGYINLKKSALNEANSDEWSIDLLHKVIPLHRKLIGEINNALKASHL